MNTPDIKKAVLKENFDTIEVTSEMIQEPNQKQIRKLIPNVSSVEVFPAGIAVYTRSQVKADRFRIHPDDRIVMRSSGGIRSIVEVLPEREFTAKYELINK